MSKKITVEICVDSVESAIAAQTGGADRVELCDNLIDGGTTPSVGAIEVARKLLQIKLHVIIRPRGGDFRYSETEFEIMKRDIETAKRTGVDGVVFGILDSDGNIDSARTAELVAISRPMSVTFHRAFDVSHDPFDSLTELKKLGVDRLLTSGQQPTAEEGAELISKLVKAAGTDFTIMGCGGLNEDNIAQFVAATGVEEVHFTAFSEIESKMNFRNERIPMGGAAPMSEYQRLVTDPEKVRRTIERI